MPAASPDRRPLKDRGIRLTWGGRVEDELRELGVPTDQLRAEARELGPASRAGAVRLRWRRSGHDVSLIADRLDDGHYHAISVESPRRTP